MLDYDGDEMNLPAPTDVVLHTSPRTLSKPDLLPTYKDALLQKEEKAALPAPPAYPDTELNFAETRQRIASLELEVENLKAELEWWKDSVRRYDEVD